MGIRVRSGETRGQKQRQQKSTTNKLRPHIAAAQPSNPLATAGTRAAEAFSPACLLDVEHVLDCVDDVEGLREAELLDGLGIGGGQVGTGHAQRRGVQVVKGLALADAGKDLGADAALGPAVLDGDEAVGLLDGLDDGLGVHGPQGAQVDDLAADAEGLELLGGRKAGAHGIAVRHQRHVGALALDLGLADRDEEVRAAGLLGQLKLHAVHELVLQADYGVLVADGRLEQANGVLRRVGRDDLEARAVGVPRAEALRVLGTDAGRRAVGAAEDDGAGEHAVGHVVGLGGRVDHVVDGLHGEVEGHELADRAEAGHGCADGHASETHLRDGRVDHSVATKRLQQAAADLICAVVLADLLAHEDDLLIAPHLVLHGQRQGIANGHLGLDGGAGCKAAAGRSRLHAGANNRAQHSPFESSD
eukprot:m.76658 g.76658  ORF g.76658 m.76658 type:complete len:418 (+) comp14651_c0_seq1:227-1480(+)